ncbi:glycoside hydrolase family 32 protein [Microbacterium hominis]|uniref:Glycoside hydrolase family 32 protein n=1 Tax=Microbacterium hominis TaxID=162426 RepID=A0A7D4UCP6_9MICO|nr:glycoside hydrolase family 32 protein [Microbacterium hominis]
MAAAAGALALAVIATVLVLTPSAPDSAPAPAPRPDADTGDPYTRPAEWGPHRPAIHLTPQQHWKNDPQKPFFLDGLWHYYYLYNADYPSGNGTAWYHATSPDLVHWTDRGIAIEKYTNGLGDIWTGTAVVDSTGSAGFGEGAVIAIVTQQSEGVQRQSLFVSHDGGYSFESFEGNPVMENPGVADFRDPRVFWDDDARRWVMVLAEHDRLGIYTSPDLRSWTYRSDVQTAGLGVLECPDLFPMSVDGDPDDVRWVLVAGANGGAEGRTTGTVYWTGDWDGETFTPDEEGHRWLDHGPDLYATVTWDDPRDAAEERLAHRYAIGWLNNWAYADRIPGDGWHGGSDSVVRRIALSTREGNLQLTSTPLEQLEELEGAAQTIDDTTVPAAGVRPLAEADADAYRLRFTVSDPDGGDDEIRVRVRVGSDGSFATVGYDFATGAAFIARGADAIAADMPEVYARTSTAPVAPRDGQVQFDVLVDVGSVEAFVNEGEATLSMATTTAPAARGIAVEAPRGEVAVSQAAVTPLRVAGVERLDGP